MHVVIITCPELTLIITLNKHRKVGSRVIKKDKEKDSEIIKTTGLAVIQIECMKN